MRRVSSPRLSRHFDLLEVKKSERRVRIRLETQMREPLPSCPSPSPAHSFDPR
jgi:hypothetical protein